MRIRLSAAGSSCRITLPIYCICRVRAPRAHPLCRDHGLVQRLWQIQPGQLDSRQGDELDPERL
jgi:hypothetical protein